MSIVSINTIKNWFKTGLKPTQAQFWDTWDSLRHKSDKVPASDIEGMDALLLNKADKQPFTAHLSDEAAHANLFNTKEDKSKRGVALGYAPLNEFTKLAIDYLNVVNDLVTGGESSLLTAEQGKLLQTQINNINVLLASDNVNLDNVQELVDAIETVQTSLSSILVNDLTTGGTTKALTAEMGKVLQLEKENASNKDNGILTASNITYPTSRVVKKEFDTLKTSQRIKTENNLARIVGNELYISSKYGTSNDWLCVFKKCMFNELYTFSRVGIIANTNSNPDPVKLTSTPTTILNEVGSDNIGPVNIATYGFIGGNHSLNNDNLTKTAVNVSYKIYLDGVELVDNELHTFNEMKIEVENTIYDPATMPTLSGLIKESVTYIIKNSTIDVSVNHDYLKNISIIQYYGMQSNYSTAYTHLYFGNSMYNDRITTYGIGVDVDSGDRATYPDVDKIVLSNLSKGNVQSMLLNTNVGLGKNRITYVTSDPLAFSTGKEYFRLIMNQSFLAGSSNHWNGSYTFYNQNENGVNLHANTVFAYETLRGGDQVFAIDTKGSINQYFPIFNSQGKDIAWLKKKETTVVAYLATSKGANVISSGADNVLFQQGRGISNLIKNHLSGANGFVPMFSSNGTKNSSLFEDSNGNVSLGITTPLSGGGGIKWLSSHGFISAFSGLAKAFWYSDSMFNYLLTGLGVGYKIQVNNGVDALSISSNGVLKVNNLAGTRTRMVFANESGELSASASLITLKNYTVSTLPTGILGDTACVTDATAPTYLGALTGGGSVKCPVFYNGTSWVSH